MLVANKFQTGFDQPLLSAMYVDKKLSGVTAVQTLSRLNRTHRTAGGEQKRKTFVIDFVNKPEDIRAAFEPYFTNATLETETDPYVVVHLADQARPGRDLHARAGARGRRTVGHPQGQQRALGCDQPGQERLRAAATRRRSRPTTRSPSTPSTCSARTSPPTSGSTTS